MSIEMEKKLGFGTMRLPLIDPDNPGSGRMARERLLLFGFWHPSCIQYKSKILFLSWRRKGI